MGDDIFVVIVGIIILVLAGIGAADLCMDMRRFDNIEEQCQGQGYIQNDRTRIYCTVEKQ